MENDNSFRDSISTVDEKGKRIWVYPKKPKGPFHNKRKVLSVFLLILLFAGPYINIGGRPMLMFNIIERKFSILGKVFWPQDFPIFALAMIIAVLFVVLFTVVFGRLFCGWVCPQTIFMEMVFRKIEYWIEGDFTHQKKLNNQKWNKEKILKKTAKHSLFWIISFLISNTFLAYIIGQEELWNIILDNPENHIGGLMAILIFTTIFYLVFSQMREQVCTTVCPYGRLQGVLLDNHSLTVAYDHVRGEKRAKFKKNENRIEEHKGDCIDCHQCVDVCPTGIDIRNGTQLECVNCTACIDACDYMMDNVGLDKGLIRLTSEENIVNKTPFKLTKRAKAYTFVLIALIGVLVTLIATRQDFEAVILRTRGTLFQKIDKDHIANIYDVNLINKTDNNIPVTLKITEGNGTLEMIGKALILEEQSAAKSKFMIVVDKNNIQGHKMNFKVGIYNDKNELIQNVKTTFISPGI